ncbi:MAG: hypothetical protein KKB81_01530 [Candidatus Margulisbacteria bacterium]|nr:hypothetical protein [Candidatus Margulisiibacteriota bacterium]MBU1021596.1 hypothetical protein [Candidatus Margulisiibacteriota bacterium]MBU1728747.1 hypothetical protein [Candidatus Margulisiibacteriota bacterium]MBU1955713.1 hypothetical protein [Candidatus Margulisiibacteriota bacterium]
MKYHKNLTRKDLLKYGWKKLLMMAASEFSRAESLANNGGGKELKSCLLRGKELLGITETDPSIPSSKGVRIFNLTRSLVSPVAVAPKTLYRIAMRLAA